MKEFILFRLSFLFIFFIAVLPLSASLPIVQGFAGIVTEKEKGLPLVDALVRIVELDVWSVTDEKGEFSISHVPSGTWEVEISCPGYQTGEVTTHLFDGMKPIGYQLSLLNLRLKNVVVTARARKNTGTSSIITQTGLSHLQTTSLSDVLQLLPGQLTQNPDLSESSVLTIRETQLSNAWNATGVALLVDGAPMNSDANLQLFSTAKKSVDYPSSAGTGVDVRKISPDRIESVEVIRGIASAEHGDLTSGAVIVTTKSGVTPYTISLRADPSLKSVSVGKGFRLPERTGVLNLDVDYARAYNDIRSEAKAYDRVSAQVGYSNDWEVNDTRLLFHVKSRGVFSRNTSKNDPEKSLGYRLTNEDNAAFVNVYGKWLLNKEWLTGIRYSFSGDIGKQESKEVKQFVGAIPLPVTYVRENGEHQGAFLPSDYEQTRYIHGVPWQFRGKISGEIKGRYGVFSNQFLLGAETSSVGNEGNGKGGENLPLGYRNRSFRDIPSLHTFSLFAEDKVRFPIGSTELELQAGVRLTRILAENYHYPVAVDPRMNVYYKLYSDPEATGLRRLALRGGWGILRKKPTLLQLYPDPAYLDQLSYSYQSADFSQGMVLYTTKVVEQTAPDEVRMPYSINRELGFEFEFAGIKGSVTAFEERLRNAMTFSSRISPMQYRKYERTPTLPVYENGVLMNRGTPVPYTTDQLFMEYTVPTFDGRVDKWGLEYVLDMGSIPALSTSFILDGAYLHIRRIQEGSGEMYKSGLINGYNRIYGAVYSGEGKSFNGQLNERLNTNLRIVTHLSRLRMIVSLTTQCVWMDRQQRLSEQNSVTRIVMRDESGKRVGGDPYTDTRYDKYVYPEALIDFSGNRIPFTEDMLQDAQASVYEIKTTPSFYIKDNPSPYVMINLRLTKEMGDKARISFYVNNLTNSYPRRYLQSSGIYERKNSEIYFGGEVNLTF